MANLEERVTILEAHADKHTVAVEALRAEIADLRVELRTEIAAIRGEMPLRSDLTTLRAELRGEITELRAEMSRRFDGMDHEFIWLAGTQVATLLAVIGVLAGALYR